jgi:hypothetical protein
VINCGIFQFLRHVVEEIDEKNIKIKYEKKINGKPRVEAKKIIFRGKF